MRVYVRKFKVNPLHDCITIALGIELFMVGLQWKSQQQKGHKLYRIQSLITSTIIINIPSGDARLCEKI